MIRLKINKELYWNNVRFIICILVYHTKDFYWQLIVKHTMFSNDILSLYDSCMTFVYYFMPYV